MGKREREEGRKRSLKAEVLRLSVAPLSTHSSVWLVPREGGSHRTSVENCSRGDGVFTFSPLNHESNIQYPCLSKRVTACSPPLPRVDSLVQYLWSNRRKRASRVPSSQYREILINSLHAFCTSEHRRRKANVRIVDRTRKSLPAPAAGSATN